MIMSETFHIISDGSCDLPTGLVQKENITVVPFYVSFDDERKCGYQYQRFLPADG